MRSSLRNLVYLCSSLRLVDEAKCRYKAIHLGTAACNENLVLVDDWVDAVQALRQRRTSAPGIRLWIVNVHLLKDALGRGSGCTLGQWSANTNNERKVRSDVIQTAGPFVNSERGKAYRKGLPANSVKLSAQESSFAKA